MPITLNGDGAISGLTATGISAVQTVSASNITTGTLPAARLPAGSVLQVVQTNINDQVGTSSRSMVTTGMSASITPSSASNKILVILNTNCDTSASNAMCGVTIYRGGTNLATALGRTNFSNNYASGTRLITAININYLDSPATTSSVTYTPYFNNPNGSTGATVYFNAVGIEGAITTLTLLEIAG
jgi:hypothetical protein